MHKSLQEFLDNNKLVTVATTDKENGVWIFNAYFGNTENSLYFVSKKSTKHTSLIKENSKVAFSLSRFNPKDDEEIEGVQGLGRCIMVKNPKDLIIGLKSIYKKLPNWKEWINEKNVFTNTYNSRLFKISISYIKYLNTKEFGDEGAKEFNF